MNQPRKFKCEFTYNQIMLLNMLIDDHIISMDNIGKDVFKDRECVQLRDAKNELLSSYLGKVK